MLDIVLKLLQALASWKRENGRPVQIPGLAEFVSKLQADV